MTITETPTETAPVRNRVRAPKRGFQWDGGTILAIVIGFAGVVLTLGPILYLIIGGFRNQQQLSADPAGLPSPWLFDNYVGILSDGLFWRQLINSTLVAFGTTAGVVLFGTMAAYPLARYSFRGREAIYVLFTTGLMFPLTVAILPLYQLLKGLDLIGSLWGLVVPQIAFALPITVIIMRPFLQALPKELEEASFVDGLTRVGFFYHMVLPLARPGMVTVGVLAFIGSWNAYLLPLLLLTGDPKGMTLPLGITTFQGQHAADITAIMAYTSLSMIPALIFFLFMERRIVDGLTGAVKG